MLPRSLAIVAVVLGCLLCGCRARPVVPDDGLAGQTHRGVRFMCPELWIEKNGMVTGTLAIENTTDEPISMVDLNLALAFLNMRSRTGTPSAEPLLRPAPSLHIHWATNFFEVPPHGSVEHAWGSPFPVTEAWRSHDGPIPVRLHEMVSVYSQKKRAEIPLIVDSTLRRR